MTTHAIRVHETGGPEVLRWEPVEPSRPRSGQALVRQTAVGLNFIDVYHRNGLYPIEQRPFIPGSEAAGVVEETEGPVPEGIVAGARVAYGYAFGAYAQRRWVDATQLVVLPDAIDDETAAALMLKGLTAYYLVHESHRVRQGETVLVHAASGATGSLIAQWSRGLGATVIGTAGGAEKVSRAGANGCDHVIDYRREDVAARALELTGGRGVDVVYDGVGAATFEGSLAALRELGLLVSFGNASGPVPPLRLLDLAPKGLHVTRPSLAMFVKREGFTAEAARALFDEVRAGRVRPIAIDRHPLRDAAEAHRRLEARETIGATVLIP